MMGEPDGTTRDWGADDDPHVVATEMVRAVEAAIDGEDWPAIEALVQRLHAADLADLIGLLARDDRDTLIHWLGDNIGPETVLELESAVLESLFGDAAPARIAAWHDDLDADDAIDLLEQLDADRLDEVLHAVPPPERAQTREGLAFPEDSAARMM